MGKIVNGAAYGHGVYVAQKHAAWLSFWFCDQPKLFICAVLDVGHVNHHGDAMVVANSAHVVPLFIASGGMFRYTSVAPSATSLRAQRHIANSNGGSNIAARSARSSKKPQLAWNEEDFFDA